MDKDHRSLRGVLVLLGQAVADRTNYMLQRADYMHDMAIALFQLSEDRLHETAAIHRRQNALLEMVLALARRGIPQPAEGQGMQGAIAEWDDILARETEAMRSAQEARLRVLRNLRTHEQPFRNLDGAEMNEGDDGHAHALAEALQYARRVFQDDDAQRRHSGIDEDARRGAAVLGVHTGSADDMDISEDDVPARNHLPPAAEGDMQDPLPAMPLIPLDGVGVQPESPTPLAITSGATPPPAAPTGNSLPASAPSAPPATSAATAVETTTPAPVVNEDLPAVAPMAPTVQVISATPQNSQDTPAGTVTTLVVPNFDQTSRPRSRSKSPVPPTPLTTRSRARSRTPAILLAAPAEHLEVPPPPSPKSSRSHSQESEGIKRKSSGEDDRSHKKRRR